MELNGVFCGVRWKSPDSDYVIGQAKSGSNGERITVCGNAPQGTLISEYEYRFFGEWDEHVKYGRQFKFEAAVQVQPHSRTGVVEYLVRYCHGIGRAIGARMWDLYGTAAVATLRTNPCKAAVECQGLSLAIAERASEDLQRIVDLEEVRIELGQLFAGTSIPNSAREAAIVKWGIVAADVIKRDPFRMLVAGIPGCGFARCDTLFLKLGHDPARLKRQTICLWFVCEELANGSTWVRWDESKRLLEGYVSSAKIKIERAFRLGVKSKWLADRVDEAGVRYMTRAEKAESEGRLADEIARLSG